jgi:hypothetical protein
MQRHRSPVMRIGHLQYPTIISAASAICTDSDHPNELKWSLLGLPMIILSMGKFTMIPQPLPIVYPWFATLPYPSGCAYRIAPMAGGAPMYDCSGSWVAMTRQTTGPTQMIAMTCHTTASAEMVAVLCHAAASA